jgi:hypothetical protein
MSIKVEDLINAQYNVKYDDEGASYSTNLSVIVGDEEVEVELFIDPPEEEWKGEPAEASLSIITIDDNEYFVSFEVESIKEAESRAAQFTLMFCESGMMEEL